MSGTDDLKELLNRLKEEVGPLPPAAPPRGPERSQAPRPRPEALRPRPERFSRPDAHTDRGGDSPYQSARELSWRENKEIILFGILSSLIAALGGVLAGLDYLVLTGAVIFSLFSALLLLSLFRQQRGSPEADATGLQVRVDALARKIEALSQSGATFQGGGRAVGESGRELEMERKVEELRVLFKSLSKAVDQRK